MAGFMLIDTNILNRTVSEEDVNRGIFVDPISGTKIPEHNSTEERGFWANAIIVVTKNGDVPAEGYIVDRPNFLSFWKNHTGVLLHNGTYVKKFNLSGALASTTGGTDPYSQGIREIAKKFGIIPDETSVPA